MPKNNKPPKRSLKASSQPSSRGFGRKSFDSELRKAEACLVKEDWIKAYGILRRLGEDYPERKIIWKYLADVCINMDDLARFQWACEQWLKIDPQNGWLLYNLGRTYLARKHPMLALQTLRIALEVDPDHENAEESRDIINNLEEGIPSLLDELKMPQDQAWEIAILHEQAQAYLEEGELTQAREAEESVLKKHPNFLSAQNNLSLIAYMEGNFNEAIEWAQVVLEQEPDNIHALSNLIRFHAIQGEVEQAQPFVKPLIASDASAWDGWTKKVEALSYLADDEGVIDLYEQALQNEDETPSTALFYHLVAVAQSRLGHDDIARTLWKQALNYDPMMAIARENLEEMSLPKEQRCGAWPFELFTWLSPQAGQDLRKWMDSITQSRNSHRLVPSLEQYFEAHPEVLKLVPRLLERCGPIGQEFIMLMVKASQIPELLEAVKSFALGKQGSDSLRHQMAIAVAEAGLLPKENVRLWLQGEWREIRLIAYQISDEPSIHHSKKVIALLQKAIPLLKNKMKEDYQQAESYLQQALKLEPDAPDLLNNLAMAYLLQDREDEAQSALEQASQKFPDYVFVAATLARQKMEEGDLEAAESLLKPCVTRERFHFDEFSAFADVQIELALAKKEKEGAKRWLDSWGQIDPEHPRLGYWRNRLENKNFFYR